MPLPTLDAVKTFLFIPLTLTNYDANLNALIVEAGDQVEDDGIENDHEKFERLVKLKTGVLIVANSNLSELIKTSETNVAGSSGEIKKEKIADVEIEYFEGSTGGGSSSSSSSTGGGGALGGNYERDYIKTLRNIVGYEHIFGL